MRSTLSIILYLLIPALICANALMDDPQGRPLFADNMVKIKLSQEADKVTKLGKEYRDEALVFGIDILDELVATWGECHIFRSHIRMKDRDYEEKVGFDRWVILEYTQPIDVLEAVKAFKKLPRWVDDACPEYISYLTAVPNDPQVSQNWGHNNTGYNGLGSGGLPGFDAKAFAAWEDTQGYGLEEIIIAIIDTGVDLSHEDLRVVAGYNYAQNNANPTDTNGHGTACAGVAAAIANNAKGVAGIAGGCTVMPLKISFGLTNTSNQIINSIIHAADNGAHIISLSLGGYYDVGYNTSYDDALTYAYDKGCTIIASTGNGNQSTIAYPACHDKVIAVGAAVPSGQRKSRETSDGEGWGSNYGENIQNHRKAVDIMGPTFLPTTDIRGSGGFNKEGDYLEYFDGTSCAAPYVAGVAALIKSKNNTLTPSEIRNILTSSATDMAHFADGGIVGWDRYTGYGLVNALQALQQVPSDAQCRITSPQRGEVLLGNVTTPINVEITYEPAAIHNVLFYVDGVFKVSDSQPPYCYDWTPIGYSQGWHTIKVVVNTTDLKQIIVTRDIMVATLPDEGFETADFNKLSWNNSSAVPWDVQSSEKVTGNYAAQAGAIEHNGKTSISISLDIIEEGDISFFYKSSSDVFDYLSFLIDNSLKDKYSGMFPWNCKKYSVTPGYRTFTWKYEKNFASTLGLDTAWLDNIVFPPHDTRPKPRTLLGLGGIRLIDLYWDAPAGYIPDEYRVYRDGTYLGSTQDMFYQDDTVEQNIRYAYYVTGVYDSVEGTPSTTRTFSTNWESFIEIGYGTGITEATDASPINVYFNSSHGQAVYLASELIEAGIPGPLKITALSLRVEQIPAYPMNNFLIRMKHTTATDASSWIDGEGMQTVCSKSTYRPSHTIWAEIQFSSPFIWNGIDNIVVDFAFDVIPVSSASGTLYYTETANGYRYVRHASSNQTNVFSGGNVSSKRPDIKLIIEPVSLPNITLNLSELDFGYVPIYGSKSQSFVISNPSNGPLAGWIDTPTGYTVAPQDGRESRRSTSSQYRNSISFTIEAGQSQTFDLVFNPDVAGDHTGQVTIIHNADETPRTIAVSGVAVAPLSPPFAEGFEEDIGSFVFTNGSQRNYWVHNTGTAHTGSYSVYIASFDEAINSYLGHSSIVHAWMPIDLPGDGNNWHLRFAWRGLGDGLADYMRVYLLDLEDIPQGGTNLTSGQIGDIYMESANWQEATIAIPNSALGHSKILAFSWRNNSILTVQPPAAIDNIRIVPNAHTDAAVVINSEVNMDLPPVIDRGGNPVHSSLKITGIDQMTGFAMVKVGYNSYFPVLQNAGLDFEITQLDTRGCTLHFIHDMGYIPAQIFYRQQNMTNWQVVDNPGNWTSSQVSFTVPANLRFADIRIAFSRQAYTTPDLDIPVLSITQHDDGIKLSWNAVDGANRYLIYTSPDPTEWPATPSFHTTQTFLELPAQDDKMFYLIKAAYMVP